MKIFGFLFGLTFLLSCKTPCKIKRAASNTEEKTIGIVHVAENNCPFYIEVIKGNKDDLKKKLYPIDFKDNYKKKGLKLSFNVVFKLSFLYFTQIIIKSKLILNYEQLLYYVY